MCVSEKFWELFAELNTALEIGRAPGQIGVPFTTCNKLIIELFISVEIAACSCLHAWSPSSTIYPFLCVAFWSWTGLLWITITLLPVHAELSNCSY